MAQADSVSLASAWITGSDALDALLEANCALRVLVGTHGNATDPRAVRRLIARFGVRSIRIVDGGPLFHPKLIRFELASGRTLVWVGSANFTGDGFGSNRELVLETDAGGIARQAEAWFDDCWRELSRQDVEATLARYTSRRRRDGVHRQLKDLVEPAGAAGNATTCRFVPTEGRGARTYTGEVVVSGNGARRTVLYGTATEALCAVLDALRRGRRGFLGRCAADAAFRQTYRNGTRSQLLGRDRDDIMEVRASRGELTEAMRVRVTDSSINPVRFAGGWWVSRDTS